MAKTTTIRNLLVRLGVDADSKGAMAFDKAVKSVKRTLLATVAAASAAAAGLFAIAKRVALAGDEAAKTAHRLGTTAESVQELGFVADITGTSIDEIEASIRRMTRTVNAADNGMASAQRTLDQLGISTKNANGETKDSVDLFEESIEALAGIESQVQRSAVAQELFGRAGTRLLTMIGEQGSSVADLRREFQSLGGAIGNEAAAASEEFNDSFVRLGVVFRGFRNQIGIALIPTITNAVDRFREWLHANSAFIRQAIDLAIEKVADAIGRVVTHAREVASWIDQLVRRTVGWDAVLSTLAATLTTIAAFKFWGLLVGAIKIVIAIFSLLSLKVIAVAAIFAGLVLVVQDVITYFRGGESVTGRLIERFNELAIVETVREWIAGLIQSVRDLWASFMDGRAGRFIAIVREAWAILKNALAPVIEELIGLAKVLWETYTVYLQLVFAIAKQVAKGIFDWWWRYTSRVLGIARTVFGAIADVVLWWWENITLPIFRAIAPIVGSVLSAAVGFFRTTFASIRDILQFFLDLVNGEFDSFGEIVDAALGVARRHFERFGDFFLGLIEDRIESVRNAFGVVFDWIADKISAVMDRFDGVRNGLARLPGLGFLGDDAGGVNGLAARGRREAVRNTALAMNAGSTNISVNGANASPMEIAQQVAAQQLSVWQSQLRQAAATFRGGET